METKQKLHCKKGFFSVVYLAAVELYHVWCLQKLFIQKIKKIKEFQKNKKIKKIKKIKKNKKIKKIKKIKNMFFAAHILLLTPFLFIIFIQTLIITNKIAMLKKRFSAAR